MRDHSRAGTPAPLLTAAVDASNGMGLRTGSATESPAVAREGMGPTRRKSAQELAARQRHAELRVLAEVRNGVDELQSLRARQVRLERLQRERQSSTKRLLAYRFAIPAVAALVFVFGGVYFEWTMGGGFLFFGNAALRSAMPWMVGILLPFFVVALCRVERVVPQLVEQLPGNFFRTVIAYPILALLCAAAVAIAPWGWLAYLGWMAGTSARVDARVLSIEPLRNYVPCGQHARLEFRGTVARICVEERLAAKALGAGDTVAVYGRVSGLGLYVREIHAK